MSAARVPLPIRYLFACLVGVAAWGNGVVGQAEGEDSCVTCHRALGAPRLVDPVELYANDVHQAAGFSCVSCHGGDPNAMDLSAMSVEAGFVADLQPAQIPRFCGRCHSDGDFMRNFDPSLHIDQEAEYATSVHGERLARTGDSLVATCVSCHPSHQIKPPSDPTSSVHATRVADTCGQCHASAEHMASYELPTDQVDEYKRSIHWEKISVDRDLTAPTCNDCHGNHGASPPGIAWVGNTCRQCHVVMADLFSRSRHAEMFTLMGQPGCATCHGNHAIQPASDDLLGLDEGAVCRNCHVEAGGGVAAKAMRSLIDSLRTGYTAAESLLAVAEEAGLEVSRALYELEGAQTALVQARASIHAFVLDTVEATVAPGLEIVGTAHDRGVEALGELRVRRIGLAVSSLIIVALISGLVLTIRNIDRRQTA